jgi:hypothetical protein
VSTSSLRTTGADPAQLALVATASDVERVIVGGRLVAERGRLLATTQETTPEQLLTAALDELAASTGTPRAATSSPTPDHPAQEMQP